tara:strand:- start:340 stop:570 length:231 start_codon:yes stop_codon:yes gene_type:complete
MNKFKINKMSGVLRMNGNNYIPHQLHQLPKKYHEIDPLDIIKMKGYVYIHESYFKNSKNKIDCLTSNKDLNYKEKR